MSTSLSLRQIADVLGGEIVNNRNGGQSVLCPGPGHSRHDRSLSVMIGDNNDIVVNSFAKDDPIKCKDFVRERIGVPAWQPNGAGLPDPIASMQAKAAAKEIKKFVTEHVYQKEDGLPYLKVTKFVGEIGGKKDFPQAYWNGNGWVSGKPPGPKIPYRLPELLASVHDTVFVCEGEKDADALSEQGFVATTASEGAGKWTADLNQYFAGKTVFVMADNDKAGADHARQVAESLTGIASEVHIVNLPNLPPKGDVSDWLDAGGETSRLIDLCKSYPVYVKPTDPVVSFTASQLQHMDFPPIKFVVPGYIVEGLTLLAGKPKFGKSWLVMHAAIAVARGGYTLGEIRCIEGDVLYCALEDNPRRLKRRMRKLLGFSPWPARLKFECTMPRLNAGGVAFVRQWIESQPEPRLVVIDTLAKVRDPRGAQELSYEADYAAVSELKALADEKGVAIVLVHHVRKMAAEDPLDTVSGTTGLTGAVDSVLVLTRDGHGTTLHGRGRDLEEIEDAATFDREACLWRIEGKAEDVRRSDERTTILAVLKDAAEPLSPREIADLSEQSYNAVRMMLTRMVKVGEINRAGRGRYEYSQTPGYNGYNVTND